MCVVYEYVLIIRLLFFFFLCHTMNTRWTWHLICYFGYPKLKLVALTVYIIYNFMEIYLFIFSFFCCYSCSGELIFTISYFERKKNIYAHKSTALLQRFHVYIWIWCRWQNCLHINLIHKRRFSCFFLSFSLKKMSQDTRSWCDEFFLIKICIDFLRVSCLIKWFYFIFLMVNKNTNNSYFNWWPILLKSVRRHLALKNINQWQCVSLPPHGDDRLNRRGKNFYQIKF